MLALILYISRKTFLETFQSGSCCVCSRRLKRIKLAERNVKSIWENTPTPPPEERRANGHANGSAENGSRQVARFPMTLLRAHRHLAHLQASDTDHDLLCSPMINGAAEELKPKQESRKERDNRDEGAKAAGSLEAHQQDEGAVVPSEAAQEDDESDDAFHAAAADLFREWLAQHKAQAAKEEEVRIGCMFCIVTRDTVLQEAAKMLSFSIYLPSGLL